MGATTNEVLSLVGISPAGTGYFVMTNISVFVHNNISIELDQDFVDLTKLWEMAGSPKEQRPSDWSHLPDTKRLISQMLTEQGFQNTEKSGIIKTKRGKGGGTVAHWKLALDYAGYLSPALKSQFYDWIKDRLEEEANPVPWGFQLFHHVRSEHHFSLFFTLAVKSCNSSQIACFTS